MRSVVVVTALVLAALVWSSSCDSRGLQEQPFVQASDDEQARYRVSLNRVVNGRFRPLLPRCLDGVRPGETVEFRNFLPDVPTNVTSVSAPEGAGLYSPNLVRPYNYIGPDHPDNDLCDATDDEGNCTARPAYTFWRHTFEAPGAYDWIDTNQGDPGRKVTDPYYGTVTFVGVDPDTPMATICVEDDEGGGCASVCCSTDADCGGETACVRAEGEAVGRCLTQ